MITWLYVWKTWGGPHKIDGWLNYIISALCFGVEFSFEMAILQRLIF